MFEQDYLMRIIAQLLGPFDARWSGRPVRRIRTGPPVPLDMALGDATDLDGEALLSLAPESLASVLQVSGSTRTLRRHIARSLMLSGRYHGEAGRADMATSWRRPGSRRRRRFRARAGARPVSDRPLEALMTASDGEA